MCVLYLDRQGATLGLREGRLRLTAKDEILADVPVEQVDQVFVYGQVQVTTAALGALLDRGVSVSLLTQRGWLHGHLQGETGGQVQRRAAQYAWLREPAAALPFARTVIVAKLRNQARLLQRWGHTDTQKLLVRAIRRARTCTDAQRLRGLEGAAARVYFSACAARLAESEFRFPRRRRHPAFDPVNALLSFGYTLLLAEVRSACAGRGLDPYAGFFHVANGAQPACALDLLEPLRVWVDALVFGLLRRGTLVPADFVTDEHGCRLADGRRGVFYQAWQALMTEPVYWRGRSSSRRAIAHAQVAELAACLDDPARPLRPFLSSEIGRMALSPVSPLPEQSRHDD